MIYDRSNIPVPGIFFISLLVLLSGSCSDSTDKNIIIGNNHFVYIVGKDGTNLHFIDNSEGKDYLDDGKGSKCAFIISRGKRYEISGLAIKSRNLEMIFGSSGVKAVVDVRRKNDRGIFEVISVTGDPESLTFVNIPLNLEGMPYETFGACALSMNLFTHVRQIPALHNELWATCYKRFGMAGAEVTLLGLPQRQILPVVRDVISEAKDIPFSDKGGAWALMQKEGYGSYLMNFGTLTEESVDEWIGMCRSLGFNQIDNHGGGAFLRFGDFELNKDKWPDGWETFRRINTRLHAAGISSIFHTYAFFIDKNSKYVTPVPSEDLGYVNSFTLKEPIDSTSDEITVNESTANISTITGFHIENSVSLRIGSELVVFSGVTKSPPYKFTGCRRGANGTRPSFHKADEKVFHLSERFGRFVPGPETPLFDEIAGNTARIVSDCGFDGIYLDAIDGSSVLGGEENFWYYGTKFVFAIASRLKRPVGMEMSSMSHHWWHYRSRWQAWDRAVRGYKRFEDIHLAAIKSSALFLPAKIKPNEWEHGLWRGHSLLIDKYASAENGGLQLPLHLGWWGNQVWNPPQVEPTFPDDIEYLCCKMIANNAGMSMLGGVDSKTLDETPLFRRITEIIRQYEELRQQNYFSEDIRKILRQPGQEFTLFREENGRWNFRPVAYQKHKIAGNGHPSSQWTVHNEFEEQPVKLRIEPLMSVKPYNDRSNKVLTDFTEVNEFTGMGSAEGVSGSISIKGENTPVGDRSGIFTAVSNDHSPKEGTWIKMEKKFDPWLDLSGNQGLGVWVMGDGNGQLLNLRIESPYHLSFGARGDHFIKIDFKGWKYFELVEIESSEFSNYMWPDSGFYVYDSYRHTVQFRSIDKLQIWYNNLPAGKEVKCLIGPVRALLLVPVTIGNPQISIGEETLIIPVRMEPGMYLELLSSSVCRLYNPRGEILQDIRLTGRIPVLKKGDNDVLFKCTSAEGINPRVQVTVISEGEPLIK